MKKISMQKIADKAGVSKSTVSNALSGKDHMLSKETKARIVALAKEIGYQKISHLIRFVVFERREHTDNRKMDQDPKFRTLYASMENQCHLLGYRIAVNHIAETDKEKGFTYIQTLADCDGLIILGWELIQEDLYWLREYLHMPFIIVDASFTEPGFDYVSNNNHDAAYQLTQKMIDCGHKRIGFIHGGAMEVYNERLRGYQNALLMNHHVFDPELVCYVDRVEKSVFVQEIGAFLQKLAKRNSPMPTAFLACDDRIAISFLASANVMNMQFSLAGFDNLPLCMEQKPQLTSVEADYACIGRTAVKRIIDKITDGDTKTQKIYVEMMVFERESISLLNG